MFRIIKADWEYNRLSNNTFFFIILAAALTNAFLIPMDGVLAFLIFAVGMINGMINGSEYVKTKRVRLLVGLPLPVKTLGIYRLYGFIFSWLLMMALLVLSSLIGRQGHLGPDYAWWILNKTGTMFIIYSCGNLSTNLFYYVKDNSLNKALMRLFVGPIVIVVAGIAALLYFVSIPGPTAYHSDIGIIISELLLTFQVSFGLLLLGILFLGVDFYIFKRRRSFTDDAGWPY